MNIVVYPGSFDPVTFGHIDILKRSLQIFDQVILAVAPNPKKMPLFSIDERIEMINKAICDIPNVEVEIFEGLLVEFLKIRKARAIIRGLRAISDFEHEFQMALMNRKLDGQAETIFLMPSEEYSYLTSSAIKEVARYGGDISQLVPPCVVDRLKKKFPKIN